MPSSAFFLKIVSVLFQYGMLLVLLMYLVRFLRVTAGGFQRESRSLRREQAQLAPHEAVLTVIEARETSDLLGRRYAFSDVLTIGRGEDCDIVVPDAFVSHHHARIASRGNQYVLEDLGSRNHTYVNDVEIEDHTYLKTGDIIRVGFVSLRFER